MFYFFPFSVGFPLVAAFASLLLGQLVLLLPTVQTAYPMSRVLECARLHGKWVVRVRGLSSAFAPNQAAKLCCWSIPWVDKSHVAPRMKPWETITCLGICRGIKSFQGSLGAAGCRPQYQNRSRKAYPPRQQHCRSPKRRRRSCLRVLKQSIEGRSQTFLTSMDRKGYD